MINYLPIRLDYYQYCVETWRGIFTGIPLDKANNIIDLCCGWAPKLELALLKSDFKGTVYIIDKSMENLDLLDGLIRPFPKKYSMRKLQYVLPSRRKLPLQTADIIWGNHILDDLIIDHYSNTNSHKNVYLYSSTHLDKIWKVMEERTECIKEIADLLINFIVNNLNAGGIAMLSQYDGYQDRLYRRARPYKICRSLMNRLITRLTEEYGFKDISIKFRNRKAKNKSSKNSRNSRLEPRNTIFNLIKNKRIIR